MRVPKPIGIAMGVCFAIVTPAFAEVSDKIPTHSMLWVLPLGVSACAYLLGRIRPWLALVPWPVGLLWAWVLLQESRALTDDLVAELGTSYMTSGFFAAAIAVLTPPVAAIWFRTYASRKK